MTLIRVAYSADMGVALVMKSLLESEGINTLDIASGGHVSIAGADQGYYIEVLAEDATAAIKLLRDNSFARFLLDRDNV